MSEQSILTGKNCFLRRNRHQPHHVTPLAGVWIEMLHLVDMGSAAPIFERNIHENNQIDCPQADDHRIGEVLRRVMRGALVREKGRRDCHTNPASCASYTLN